MTFLAQDINVDPELAACYKKFVDLLARMREADIQLHIYDTPSIERGVGATKTTTLTLCHLESNSELPVAAVQRAFPIFRVDNEVFIESDDHLGSLLSFAALTCIHSSTYREEYKNRNILDCSLRELLGPNFHIIRYVDEMYANMQKKPPQEDGYCNG